MPELTAQDVTVTPTANGVALAMWSRAGGGLCPVAVRELTPAEAEMLISKLLAARPTRS